MNWFNRHRVWTTIIGIFVVLMVVGSLAGTKDTENSTPTNNPTVAATATQVPTVQGTVAPTIQATVAPTVAPTVAVTEVPTAVPTATEYFTWSGNGDKNSKPFTIDPSVGNVDLVYTYNCGNFGSGNFIVNMYGSSGTFDMQSGGVDELGSKGSNSTTIYLNGDSPYHLEVITECSKWTIKVVPTP